MTIHRQISFQISLHWHATMEEGTIFFFRGGEEESTIFLEVGKLVIKQPYLLRQFSTWDYKTKSN